jgi:hypothetical protein
MKNDPGAHATESSNPAPNVTPFGILEKTLTERHYPRLAAFLLDFRRREPQDIDFQGFVLHIGSQIGAIARRTIGQYPVL